MVFQYYGEHGFEATINEVIVPTVITAAEEFDHDNISVENLLRIMSTSRELIVEIGNRFNKIQRAAAAASAGHLRARRGAQPRAADPVQLMRQDEVAATLVSENKTTAELREFIRGFAPDLVCRIDHDDRRVAVGAGVGACAAHRFGATRDRGRRSDGGAKFRTVAAGGMYRGVRDPR